MRIAFVLLTPVLQTGCPMGHTRLTVDHWLFWPLSCWLVAKRLSQACRRQVWLERGSHFSMFTPFVQHLFFDVLCMFLSSFV